MLEKFRQSLSYGVLEWVRPKKLVEAINTCCRIVAESFCGRDGVVNSSYNSTGIRPAYACAMIPVSYIHNSTVVAGEDTELNSDDVLGAGGDGNFFVSGLPEGIVAIGKSPDSVSLLLYSDFVPHHKGYIFKKNPCKHGTILTISGEPTITFFYVGGKPRVKSQPQFKHLYGTAMSKTVITAIDNSISKALCLAGVSNAVINAAAEVGTVAAKGTMTNSPWTEGDRNYIGIGEDVYSCPRSMPINICDNNNPSTDLRGIPITDEHMDRTIVFPACGLWYWIDESRLDKNSLPDLVYSEYPELNKSGDVFQQLKAIMRLGGICTVDATESNGSSDRLLAKYTPGGNFIRIIRHLDVSMNSAKTGVDRDKVDAIYVLYGEGGENIIKPCDSVHDLLHDVDGTHGVLRVSGCINSNGVLYAISSNSVTIGKRVTNKAKIYGIVAVISGKRPEEDVVYSYRNVNNESFGTGLEVIVTVTL